MALASSGQARGEGGREGDHDAHTSRGARRSGIGDHGGWVGNWSSGQEMRELVRELDLKEVRHTQGVRLSCKMGRAVQSFNSYFLIYNTELLSWKKL
jgi:hypothetical protein